MDTTKPCIVSPCTDWYCADPFSPVPSATEALIPHSGKLAAAVPSSALHDTEELVQLDEEESKDKRRMFDLYPPPCEHPEGH